MPSSKPKPKPKPRSRAKLPPITFPPHQHPRILRRAKELKQSPTDYVQSLVDMDLADSSVFRRRAGSLPKFEDFLPKSDEDISDQEIVELVKDLRRSAKNVQSGNSKRKNR